MTCNLKTDCDFHDETKTEIEGCDWVIYKKQWSVSGYMPKKSFQVSLPLIRLQEIKICRTVK